MFLILALLIGSGSVFCLPEVIEKLVLRQKLEFESALGPLNKQQRHRALERYADLLMKAHFTMKLDINRDELRKFVFAQNRYLDKEQESPQKKSKRAPAYSEAIEAELAKMVDAFSGQFRGEILELQFVCGEQYLQLPFSIVEMGKQYEMTIKGVPIEQPDKAYAGDPRCLALDLDPKNLTSTLGWIGTQEAACPIPDEKGGECLLRVAESMAKAAGKKVMRLIDASEIKCEVNRQITSLGRLKLYQKGQTWYEQNGYVSDDLEERVKSIDEFQRYSLASLLKNLTQITPKKSTALSRRILAKEAEAFAAAKKGETVAEFMAWLWDKDCASYIEVDKFIAGPFTDLEFAKRIPQDRVMHKDL